MKKFTSLLPYILLLITLSHIPVFSQAPTNGLVGYWPFNGNANDLSGFGNNGTVSGATLTTDRFGAANSAYSFNGSSYISVGNFPITRNTFSITFWFNTTDTTLIQRPVTHNWPNGAFSTDLSPQYGFGAAIQNVSSSQTNIYGVGNPRKNNWYHYALTYDGSILKLFVNGSLVSSSLTGIGLKTINTTLFFGGNPSFFFKGKIDDIRIYNRAISSLEISESFNDDNTGLIAHYPFNGNAKDASGNGNHGTVNGAILTTDRFGKANSAYYFDGSSNIQAAIPLKYSPSTFSHYSLSFWFKKTVNATSKILVAYNTTNNVSNYDILSSHSNCATNTVAVQNYPFNNPSACSPTIVNLNEWTHLYVSYNQVVDSVNVHKNGLFWFKGQIGSSAPLAGFLNFGNNIANGIFGFTGVIDDIKIFNKSLSNSEIQDLFNESICSQSISVTDTLKIKTTITNYNPITYQNTIKIYPNPAKDQITIDYGNFASLSGSSLKIFNTIGQAVFTTSITQQQSVVNLSSLGGNGVYFVRLLDASGNTVDVKKIVVE